MTFPTGFTRLLDGLPDGSDAVPRQPRVPFGLFAQDDGAAPAGARTPPGFAAAAYGGQAADEPPPSPAGTRPPSHRFDKPLPSLDPADIAAELRLPCSDPARLARARKDFALRNHPDRVPPHLRERASRRMQVANALVDEALRQAAGARR